MKGKGPRIERETSIVWNEEEDKALIWTASEITYQKLRKLGYSPTEDRERSASFIVPKRDIKMPRPLDEARSRRVKEMIAAGKTGFKPRQRNRSHSEPPNPSEQG